MRIEFIYLQYQIPALNICLSMLRDTPVLYSKVLVKFHHSILMNNLIGHHHHYQNPDYIYHKIPHLNPRLNQTNDQHLKLPFKRCSAAVIDAYAQQNSGLIKSRNSSSVGRRKSFLNIHELQSSKKI